MLAGQYTALDHVYLVGSYGSDQLSFHQYGYRATAGAEYGGSYPWYHTTGDTIGNLSMALAAEVAKMAVATAALLAVTPAPPTDFALRDLGASGSLHAAWTLNAEPDVAGYKLLWGTAARAYTDSVILGRVGQCRISGLTNGTRYYAAVVAFDSTGHESGFSPEQSAIPGLVPLPPAAPLALPGWFSMEVCWRANQELDFAGYNICRSTRSRSGYARLNSGLVTDTTWHDSSLLSDTMYYYVITAVDTQGYESDSSAEVRGKPVTLDHGILLVDETRDGTGQPGSPSDQQQDAFYHGIMHGFSYTDWDAAQQGVPTAGDVGPYSTIVWHADEFQQQQLAEAAPGIANHLAHDGRLWLVGWKPVLGMMGSGRYPYNFAAGQFPYDLLHLRRAEQSLISDFIGAAGVSGYPDIAVDSAKLLPAMHGRLPFTDALLPRDAEAVLTFNSYSGDTFAGKPVGVRWTGGPHRAVCFGFPLYYCRNAEARQLAIRVLADLGEPYGVAEQPAGPQPRSALAVLPNPVAGSALVSYSVPAAGPLRICLYDAAGRLVRVLAAGSRQAGSWSLRLDRRSLRAGVYFCRLESGVERKTARVEIVD
ncbi:T9SS type A sorting domain-containing protein [candidate division WOR-3 bacterium]|nr:T9SS type A sorting domain-containing protein [candidate division WOR-3 bacterium]